MLDHIVAFVGVVAFFLIGLGLGWVFGLRERQQRAAYMRDRLGCADCGRAHPSYMLKDSVWAEAIAEEPKRDTAQLLCMSCVEARLGRPLEHGDLDPVPVNDPLWGWAKPGSAWDRYRQGWVR